MSEAAGQDYRASSSTSSWTNRDALALYEDLGFEIIGRQPQAFHWRRERYVDALLLYRFLNARRG